MPMRPMPMPMPMPIPMPAGTSPFSGLVTRMAGRCSSKSITWTDIGEFSSSTSRSCTCSWLIRTVIDTGRILYWFLSTAGVT